MTYSLSKCLKLKKVSAVKLAQAIEACPNHLELVECMPETDRFGFVTATSSKHLRTLSSKCANIRSLSIFSENGNSPLDWTNNTESSSDLVQDCVKFESLQVLNSWGGYLKLDLILSLKLTQLKLVHVEDLKIWDLKKILEEVTSLESLEIQNCGVQDNATTIGKVEDQFKTFPNPISSFENIKRKVLSWL